MDWVFWGTGLEGALAGSIVSLGIMIIVYTVDVNKLKGTIAQQVRTISGLKGTIAQQARTMYAFRHGDVMTIERKLLTCRHFNGVGRDDKECCRVGVNYRSHVGGEDFGWLRRLPCLPKSVDEDILQVVLCKLRVFPTPEEAAAEEAHDEELLSIIPLAIKLCRAHADGKKGIIGVVKCPKCGGHLHYSVARPNGHLHGTCKTEGCLSWVM